MVAIPSDIPQTEKSDGITPITFHFHANSEPDGAAQLLLKIDQVLRQFGFQQPDVRGRMSFFWIRIALCSQPNPFEKRQVGLIAAPTGSGKTSSVRHLCEALAIPCHVADVSRFVAEGIVGTTVSDELTSIYLTAKQNGEKWSSHRVLLLDEFHTLINKSSNYGESVLRQLLALIAGEPINFAQGKHHGGCPPQIRTHRLTILIAGSFDGMLTRLRPADDFDEEDSSTNGDELAGASSQQLLAKLEAAGVPGEFLGRCTLPPLTIPMPTAANFFAALSRDDDLNPMRTLLAPFAKGNITLKKKTVLRIVEQSIRRNLGYRSLRQVCDEVLHDSFPLLLNGATEI